jgi:hypothetical protein
MEKPEKQLQRATLAASIFVPSRLSHCVFILSDVTCGRLVCLRFGKPISIFKGK